MNTSSINWTVVIIVLGIVVVIGDLIFTGGAPQRERTYIAPPAHSVATEDISRSATDIPKPITRTTNTTLVYNLDAVQLVGELADGTTYEYWTYNSQVPGPFMRIMEGDTVEIHLKHSHDHTALSDDELHSFAVDAFIPLAHAQEDHEHAPGTPADHHHDDEMGDMTEAEHIAAGHGEHSIDLHAVQGPGGGADLVRTGPNETLAFRFKATKPGLYIYHCGSPHVATHIANGMYGLILVEPKGGLPAVDHEFYVVQGEFYTAGPVGQQGHQAFSLEKLLKEEPEYVVFNGRMGALTGNGALRAKTGETVRIFLGVSGQLASNFHVIGEIFDNLYREGDIVSEPAHNVQTTLIPGGGAAMIEFTVDVPGTYLLVDHALSRALNRGALGQLIVEGEERPDLYQSI